MMPPARSTKWWTIVGVLIVASVAAIWIGLWQLMMSHRPSAADQPEQRQAAIDAARTNISKVLTYQADIVEQQLRAAAEVTTGEYGTYYRKHTAESLVPEAKQNGVDTIATVVDVGVVSLTADRASILAFVDQSTTTYEKPEPATTTSAVRVEMIREGGHWRIATFDQT